MAIKQYNCFIQEKDYIEIVTNTDSDGLSIQIYADENHIVLNKEDAIKLANDILESYGIKND